MYDKFKNRKMISFDNTEIAFHIKSDAELNKAYFLFQFIGNKPIVKTGKLLLNAALSIHLPFSWMVKPTIYFHFTGGETIEECRSTVKKLAACNVKSILDYSVEGKESSRDFDNTMAETLKTIENAKKDPNISFAVFKPTAFTVNSILQKASAEEPLTVEEKHEINCFRKRVNRLCEAAYQADVCILIDAEDTCFQKLIDETVTQNMQRFNKEKAIVFNTHQMYRWDRLDYLKKDYQKAVEGNYYIGVKLVRGAYMERERIRAEQKGYRSPIQPDKESTDRDYNLALKFCVEHINRISVFNGTHNEYSALYLTELMAEHNISKDDPRCFSSQLFGMSDNISFNLAKAGYNVAKYLPYGPLKSVLPYLIRRAEENSSISGQMGRELSLIVKEKKRRKAVVRDRLKQQK